LNFVAAILLSQPQHVADPANLPPAEAGGRYRSITMTPDDIGAHTPQIRPHIQRRDGKLFFMMSRRPLRELPPEEVPLYESIDGRKTLAELEEKHPGASDRLLRWREAEILELIPPITSPAGPHLVVIEPHMDDAVLSAGGRLLHRRGRCRITILSVGMWRDFTFLLLFYSCHLYGCDLSF